MQPKFTHFLGLAIMLFSSAAYVSAQDGSIDAGFGNNGRVWNSQAEYERDPELYITPRVLVLSDGRILHISTPVTAKYSHISDGFKITRYMPNGEADASFGTAGTRTYMPSSGLREVYYAVLQPDEKILLAGSALSGSNYVFSLMRLNADGTPDNSFDGDGKVVTDLGPSTARSIALQPDGKIVAVGHNTTNFTMPLITVRYNPNGSLDTGFSSDGIETTNLSQGFERSGSVAIGPDGKIYVAGQVRNYTVINDPYDGPYTTNRTDGGIFRLLPDGTLDRSFGTNGLATFSTPERDEKLREIEIQNDGKILLGGNLTQVEGRGVPYPSDLFVYRYTQSGTLDPEFNGTGIRRITFSERVIGADMALQQDGKILVSGFLVCYTGCSITEGDLVVVRLLANGSNDNSFDGDGMAKVANNTPSIEYGPSLASQGTKLILGGYAVNWGGNEVTRDFLARLQNSSAIRSHDPQLYYKDIDGDGYGNNAQTMVAYSQPPASATRGGDCNDGNSAINPGATEVLNGIDDNCNGQIDEGLGSRHYTLIPARIEAENYSAMHGVQNEPTQDAGGGQNVGYIDIHDWMDYNLFVRTPGWYALKLRLATPSISNPEFEVRIGNNLLAKVKVPNTGSFQAWTTVTVMVNLPAGNQTVRLISTGGGYWNINWLDFALPTYTNIPGKIEAEHYSNMYGIQTEPTMDAGGGENVGYIDHYDWMEYNIHVPSAGWYNVDFRVATPSISNPEFEVRFGVGSTVKLKVPNTGGFQNWTTISIWLQLPAGNQTIRLTSTGGGYWNINWLEFSFRGATATEMVVKPGAPVSVENAVNNSVNIYPNPVRDVFNLELDNKHTGAVRVEIVSVTGRMEKGFTVNKADGKSRHNLSLSGLAKGEYILRITQNGYTQTRKIIKL
jgi:uncharacterized delta-60 repeat protein